MAKTLIHDFYCINCGNKGIPVARNNGQLRGRLHRKKMYCIYCQTEVNHIECRSDEEVRQFKENFEKGLYKEEAQESLSYVQSHYF